MQRAAHGNRKTESGCGSRRLRADRAGNERRRYGGGYGGGRATVEKAQMFKGPVAVTLAHITTGGRRCAGGVGIARYQLASAYDYDEVLAALCSAGLPTSPNPSSPLA
jgi:hypothetical protein